MFLFLRSGSMQARVSPRVTRRWLREEGKCHKSNPDQPVHTNLLSQHAHRGMIMADWWLTLFRGSH